MKPVYSVRIGDKSFVAFKNPPPIGMTYAIHDGGRLVRSGAMFTRRQIKERLNDFVVWASKEEGGAK